MKTKDVTIKITAEIMVDTHDMAFAEDKKNLSKSFIGESFKMKSGDFENLLYGTITEAEVI